MSRKPYSSMKDSGLSWLGQVPNHWSIQPIWAVASCNDEVLPEATADDQIISYVEISDVEAGRGIIRSEELLFVNAPSRARRIVQCGDVIVSTVRTYLRAIGRVLPEHSNCIVSTGFAVLRPATVHAGYLSYLLTTEFMISEVISRSTGVSYPALKASELMKLKFALPSSNEQKAISAFLDRETTKIDVLIAEQERLLALLAEKRQAVISRAVTQGLDPSMPMKDSGVEWLGRVPNHWGIHPLGALFRFTKRQEGKKLRVVSVYRDYGVIYKDDRDDNNNKTPEDLSLYQTVVCGDLVVNKMKAWQGSLGISSINGITSPDYAVFAPKDERIKPCYANWLLRCSLLPDVYRSISNGIRPDQWRLEPDKFKTLLVPCPPTPEQRAISQHLAEVVGKFDGLSDETQRGISLLGERRTALISAAVTGKIDVRGLVPIAEPAREAA